MPVRAQSRRPGRRKHRAARPENRAAGRTGPTSTLSPSHKGEARGSDNRAGMPGAAGSGSHVFDRRTPDRSPGSGLHKGPGTTARTTGPGWPAPDRAARRARRRVGQAAMGGGAGANGRETMATLTLLGIESSCDETAAAVVAGDAAGEGPGRILSNAVFGQADLHAAYGGVVPEIAARAHAERADLVIARALDEAGTPLSALDAIAVTAGPGLIGGVLVGVMTAKGLAAATGLPLVGVNHLEGHALTPRLTDGVPYPYLLLLVSGGHCQFLAVDGLARYRRLGGTIDDAPGEAFDKIARAIGLGFPGGPEVERAAAGGDPARFAFPRPLLDRDGCDLSFSGLKTSVVRAREELVAAQGGLRRRDIADICAAFQAATAEVLAAKARAAMRRFAAAGRPASGGGRTLAVAGGVAANAPLRTALAAAAAAEGFRLVAPPLALCTDNGAMIAWAGLERLAAGLADPPVVARPRWPLDGAAAPMLGAGKRGAKA